MATMQPYYHQVTPMPKRVEIRDELLERLRAVCPKYLSPTGFINLALDRALGELTGGAKVPAYCVGAEEGLGNLGTKAQPLNAAGDATHTSPPVPSRPDFPPIGGGQGVGRGSGGSPRDGRVQAKKPENPPEKPFRCTDDADFAPPIAKRDYASLLPAKAEIVDFWNAKSGSVTLRAWNGLLRECEKIRVDAAGGMAVLKDELTKAAERGQQGIDHARWMAYGVNRFAKNGTPAQAKTVNWEEVDHVSFFK